MLISLSSFASTPHATFSKVFFLHTSSASYIEEFLLLALLMLVFVRSFSYTPHASFGAAKAEVGDKRLYTPDAGFSKVFFLHTSYWFY